MLNKIATWISMPLGWVILQLYKLTSNFGLTIIFAAVLVRIIILPFKLKSDKSMELNSKLQVRIKELEKECAGDKEKFQKEVEKLYLENNTNPFAGCIWQILPFPILIAMFMCVSTPLTTVMGIGLSELSEGGGIYQALVNTGYTVTGGYYEQLDILKHISLNSEAFSNISNRLIQMDYRFFGLDLSVVPQLSVLRNGGTTEQYIALVFPLLVAFIPAFMSMLLVIKRHKANGERFKFTDLSCLIIPLLLLATSFSVPLAISLYWIVSNILSYVNGGIFVKKKAKNEKAAEAAFTEAYNNIESISSGETTLEKEEKGEENGDNSSEESGTDSGDCQA